MLTLRNLHKKFKFLIASLDQSKWNQNASKLPCCVCDGQKNKITASNPFKYNFPCTKDTD